MKEKAIKAGYINFGYFSPEASNDSEYPSYIKENVDDAICKIKSHQNENSITFAFMTDLHYSKTPVHELRMKRLMNAYKEIRSATGTDMLVLGGDYVNNGKKEYNKSNYHNLKEHLMGIDYFPVNGNHDDNSMWDEYTEVEKGVNHHTTSELYNMFYNHLPSLGAKVTSEDALYYYYDAKEENVRYIFLDTNDIPEVRTETGALKYAKQHTFGISQNQVDWLVNTALKTKKGTDIIIVTHNALSPSYENEENVPDECRNSYLETKAVAFLNKLFDAYNKKNTFSVTCGEGVFEIRVNADFSHYDGNIAGVVAGHTHYDLIEKTEGGIPYIYTGCAAMYNYKVTRIDGDKSELLFDVVTFDRQSKKFYITRIGAGQDRTV